MKTTQFKSATAAFFITVTLGVSLILVFLAVRAWPEGPAEQFEDVFEGVKNFDDERGSTVGAGFHLVYEVHEKSVASNVTHIAVLAGERRSIMPLRIDSDVQEFSFVYRFPSQRFLDGGKGWELVEAESMIQVKGRAFPFSVKEMWAAPDDGWHWIPVWVCSYSIDRPGL